VGLTACADSGDDELRCGEQTREEMGVCVAVEPEVEPATLDGSYELELFDTTGCQPIVFDLLAPMTLVVAGDKVTVDALCSAGSLDLPAEGFVNSTGGFVASCIRRLDSGTQVLRVDLGGTIANGEISGVLTVIDGIPADQCTGRAQLLSR
jgi:hypothetical protein